MTHPISSQTSTGIVFVECGRLIDGSGRPPRNQVSLVIENGVIREVVPTSRPRAEWLEPNASVIDASNATVLPGLMDLHVHLNSIVDPDEPNVLLSMMDATAPLATLHAAKNARLMVEAGFTTLRDVAGSTSFGNAEVVGLRRAIEIGLVSGPRIFAAGCVMQTAGHHDMVMPRTWSRPHDDRADGPWEVRRQVRELVRGGVDLIKTSASGGAGHGEERWWRNYTTEELEALCDEAHAYGRKVAVHVHSARDIRRAVLAGVDTVEHGTGLDDETMALLAERGTFFVPTLSVRSPRGLAGRARSAERTPSSPEHRALHVDGIEIVGKAHRAGVKIACGTDTYRSLRHHWGENASELELLVQGGLTPMEAMVAATRVSAEALGQQDRLGVLEAGKAADLLVFQGDPLEDIRLLQERERITLVLKAGQIIVDRRDPQRRMVGKLPWNLGG